MKKGLYIFLFLSFFTFSLSGKESESLTDSLISKATEYSGSQPERALEFSLKAYRNALESGDSLETVKSLLSLGESYRINNKNDTAIQLIIKAQKLAFSLKDTHNIGLAYIRMGAIYYGMEYTDKALKAWENALALYQKTNNLRGLNNCYNNIAAVYFHKNEFEKSIRYFKKSLKLDKKLGDMNGALTSTINIAGLYTASKNYPLAKQYYQKALELGKKYSDSTTLAILHNNTGRFYLDINDCKKALPHLEEALRIYKHLGKMTKVMLCYANLADYYECLNNYEKAFRYQLKHSDLLDSLNSVEKTKAIAELETKYQSERKERENKILKQNNKIQNLQLERQKQNISRQRYIIAGGIGFLVLIILLAVQLYRNNKIKQKANTDLSRQKKIVEKKNGELQTAFHEIEEKNHEITDSINYAKRIQSAILPSYSELDKHLESYFIFYQPKDIVAGDFYWLEKRGSITFFAVADCTGHGVPGALVSVICSNALNQCVNELDLKDPGQILTEARKLVVKRFEKSENVVRDGMDISICAWEKANNKVHWAGANNPLWIIRDAELLEYKPDKQAIGEVDNPKPYSTHSIDLKTNDMLYLFSDGYQDQFGGEKGKKLKVKNFKKLLLSFHDKSVESQQKIAHDYFHEWKGEIEQVDDVCLMGLRIK